MHPHASFPRSIDVPDHDGVEILKGDFPIAIAIRLLQHALYSLLVQILLQLPIDLPQVLQVDVSLILPIVLPKDPHDVLLPLVEEGPRVHGVHELPERDTARLLHVELGDYLVDGPLVRLETVLGEKELQVVGEEDAHAGRVVEIEDLLQIQHVLLSQRGRTVIDGIELPQILPPESHVVDVGRSLASTLLGLTRTRTHVRATQAATSPVLEGTAAGSGLLCGEGTAHDLNWNQTQDRMQPYKGRGKGYMGQM